MIRATRILVLCLVGLAACRMKTAAALRDSEVRLQLSRQLVTTLDRQEHYFSDAAARFDFEQRLDGIAEATEDAVSYYQALSDALADLEEGHTGLVGSVQVPFSNTIPPVAVLEIEAQPIVAGVSPGVEAGGLRPGDAILEVDGVPAARALAQRLKATAGSTSHGRRARAVSNLLAGPTNSPARVRVRGMDGRERLCYPLRFLLDDEGMDRFRFGFLPHTVTALRITPAAAYLGLPDFHPDRRVEMERALEGLGTLPVLVLDLRGNPGGRIRTLQRIAGIFFDEPVDLLRVIGAGGPQSLTALPGPVYYRGSVKILVDERTGSAAELLAAALKDLGRATVFGRPTAGSSRSRLSALLPGGVVFHYAGRSEFQRRDGTRVEGVGVEPDVHHVPTRGELAGGSYGDPFRDPLVRLAFARN